MELVRTLDPVLEVREVEKGQFGVYEAKAPDADPLVVTLDQNASDYLLAHMTANPETILYTKLLNRLTNAIYGLEDKLESLAR